MTSRSVVIENCRSALGFTPTWLLKFISAFEMLRFYEFIIRVAGKYFQLY